MPYLVTNVTDATSDPKQISFHDIGNRVIVTLEPGETADLERFSTRNQILDSTHLKVHLREGRVTVDTLGSSPRERIYVDAVIDSTISVGTVTLEEPLLISVNVAGTETPISGVTFGGLTYAGVSPLLPNTPKIDDIFILAPNTEQSFTLPVNTRKFLVYLEDEAPLKMGFSSGGNKITINCGANYAVDEVNANSLTLYFESDEVGNTVKVLSWAVS